MTRGQNKCSRISYERIMILNAANPPLTVASQTHAIELFATHVIQAVPISSRVAGYEVFIQKRGSRKSERERCSKEPHFLQPDFWSACFWWFNYRVARYTCPGVFHSICSKRCKLGGERRVG